MHISIKLFLVFGFILLAVLALSACKTAKDVQYHHEPSETFYKKFDFKSERLKTFKTNDILLVIDINKTTHTSYVAWLGLFSDKTDKSIKIDRAIIRGRDWKKEHSFGRGYKLNSYLPETKLFELDKGLKLFEVNSQDLKDSKEPDGDLSITVFYDSGSGPESMTFSVKRKVKKQMVFPT